MSPRPIACAICRIATGFPSAIASSAPISDNGARSIAASARFSPVSWRRVDTVLPRVLRRRTSRRRQIHFQDRHVEGVGDFAVFLILEDQADEFAGDMNFHGIR